MTARLYIATTADLPAVMAAGPYHPEYGRLLDVGTSVVVEPVNTGAVTEAEQLAREADGRLELIVCDPAEPGLAAELELRAQDDVVLLLLLPPAATAPSAGALFAAIGPGLPVMGSLGTRAPDVVPLTIRTILGEPQLGSIFTEPEDSFGADSEQRLVARMRQLYGE